MREPHSFAGMPRRVAPAHDLACTIPAVPRRLLRLARRCRSGVFAVPGRQLPYFAFLDILWPQPVGELRFSTPPERDAGGPHLRVLRNWPLAIGVVLLSGVVEPVLRAGGSCGRLAA